MSELTFLLRGNFWAAVIGMKKPKQAWQSRGVGDMVSQSEEAAAVEICRTKHLRLRNFEEKELRQSDWGSVFFV